MSGVFDVFSLNYLFFSAETERKAAEHLDLAGVPLQRSRDAAPVASTPEAKKKSRGLRKFFGR